MDTLGERKADSVAWTSGSVKTHGSKFSVFSLCFISPIVKAENLATQQYHQAQTIAVTKQ